MLPGLGTFRGSAGLRQGWQQVDGSGGPSHVTVSLQRVQLKMHAEAELTGTQQRRDLSAITGSNHIVKISERLAVESCSDKSYPLYYSTHWPGSA